MATAKRDPNRVPTLIGVSSSDGVTPVLAEIDPTTGELLVKLSGDFATKVTTVGAITYVAIAPPGTAQATALWQIQKIDTTTGTVITFADGNAKFDNVATDITEPTITYS